MAYILVVDNDDTIRGLVYEVLSNIGHTVCDVANGADAIRLCQQYGFDLIILDYSIPHMNGLEVARQFGSKSPYILHTTDYDNHELKCNALNAGALGVIAKISNIKEFVQAITQYLQQI